MKKILKLVLLLLISVTFVGCSGNSELSSNGNYTDYYRHIGNPVNWDPLKVSIDLPGIKINSELLGIIETTDEPTLVIYNNVVFLNTYSGTVIFNKATYDGNSELDLYLDTVKNKVGGPDSFIYYNEDKKITRAKIIQDGKSTNAKVVIKDSDYPLK